MYAKFATTPKEQLALTGQQTSASADVPYPEASAAQSQVPYPEAHGSSQNWMNWKPDNNDDDTMVQNVLGAVADLTKKKSLRGQAEAQEENPLQAEAARMEDQGETVTEPTTQAAPSEPVQAAVVEVADKAPAVQTKIEGSVQDVATNSLTSFSFDDSSTTTTTTMPVASKGANPLASWLGIVKPHVQAAAPAPEQKPANPYLMDLQ